MLAREVEPGVQRSLGGGPGTRRSSRWFHRMNRNGHQALGAELLATDHRTPEGDQSLSHHPDAPRNQQPTAMPSSPLENSQPLESDGRDQVQLSSVPSSRTRQHDCHDRTLEGDHGRHCRLAKPDPIASKSISSATTTHPSQTSTTVALPLEDSSTRSLEDTVSECTDETGPADPKRPRTSEFRSALPFEGGASSSVECPEALTECLR